MLSKLSLEPTTSLEYFISFHCLVPTNEVGFVDADIPKKVNRENVTGELSTIPGIEVTVTPSGNIK